MSLVSFFRLPSRFLLISISPLHNSLFTQLYNDFYISKKALMQNPCSLGNISIPPPYSIKCCDDLDSVANIVAYSKWRSEIMKGYNYFIKQQGLLFTQSSLLGSPAVVSFNQLTIGLLTNPVVFIMTQYWTHISCPDSSTFFIHCCFNWKTVNNRTI